MKKIKKKSINILVDETDNIMKNKKAIKIKEIICPKCKEKILIEIKDYKINLYDCKNGHKLNNIPIKEFEKLLYNNKSKIICKNCNEENIDEVNNNEFILIKLTD